MKSMYKPNISATARMASSAAGAALAIVGYKRSNNAIKLLGMGLMARGASGWCPVTAAIDPRLEYTTDTKRHLSGSGGIMVEDAVTIYRPVSEVYTYWRNLENLPRFMNHLVEVRAIDRVRSRWVARGPLGIRVEWDAEVINDIPPTLLSWKSVGQSDVISAGSVRFKPVGDHGTEVRVRLQYDPPGGKLGATVAALLGEDPQHQIAEDLRVFKQLLETGEGIMPQALDSSEAPRDFGDFGSVR